MKLNCYAISTILQLLIELFHWKDISMSDKKIIFSHNISTFKVLSIGTVQIHSHVGGHLNMKCGCKYWNYLSRIVVDAYNMAYKRDGVGRRNAKDDWCVVMHCGLHILPDYNYYIEDSSNYLLAISHHKYCKCKLPSISSFPSLSLWHSLRFDV